MYRLIDGHVLSEVVKFPREYFVFNFLDDISVKADEGVNLISREVAEFFPLEFPAFKVKAAVQVMMFLQHVLDDIVNGSSWFGSFVDRVVVLLLNVIINDWKLHLFVENVEGTTHVIERAVLHQFEIQGVTG